MFEYDHYRWKHDPNDGEYELQFDRFETSPDGDYRDDQAVLLIADKEDKTELIGQVILPTADVPEIERDNTVRTAIFHGTIKDGKITELRYEPELTEQRIEEARERHNRVRKTDNEYDTEHRRTGEQ